MDFTIFSFFTLAHRHRPAGHSRRIIHRKLQGGFMGLYLRIPFFDFLFHFDDIGFKSDLVGIWFLDVDLGSG